MPLTLFSPAKLNLFLHVLGKRPDGYHNLASLFQAIDLGDNLTFSLQATDELTLTDPNVPSGPDNLILKAVHLFRKKTELEFGLRIHVDKQIPMEAGLGGGSSNGATTLYALNQLLNTQLPDSKLQTWSAELGSDIPFFFSTGTAYCEGRGERVTSQPPISLSGKLWLIKPTQGLSTKAIFHRWQASTHSEDPKQRLAQFLQGQTPFYNELEKPTFELFPELGALKANLQSQGYTVGMTGSGSALFFITPKTVTLPPIPPSHSLWEIHPLNRKEGWYQKVHSSDAIFENNK